mmetsp:Transcript_12855/g.15527  ORF Transcript_12855/g.15527 Transcript_12855/m.15527 type:complete len:323 (-) Transcript_12855:132-1100(-)|eukprot:CAMPEP_0197862398 /NCGR_PEP_ID=MMETSP1438-20131217/39127_1 /TAXON_ID=1461541 /ORGANISM="Pterosperma sp., Strain CCMP1384" /LENGTH=322 /DNA_ID=CAMNT_0043479945 /DNA_START=419 /DNA_END=1387 /DNA_ORIENTATION=+
MANWKVEDDILLCKAVEEGALLEALAHGAVQFSSKFTVEQVRSRWKSLLYDPNVAYPAATAMKQAHEREEVAAFSSARPSVQSMYEKGRSSSNVERRDDPASDEVEEAESPLPPSFSDVEMAILEHESASRAPTGGQQQGETVGVAASQSQQQDKPLPHRIGRRTKKHKDLWWIMKLERTASMCTARRLSKLNALAALQGTNTRFLITKPEVIIGRSTDEQQVDIDLSEEGNASKVSRQQAVIELRNGSMHMCNTGRKQILVNNCIVESGKSRRLESNCLIEVGGLRFLFMTNKHLIRKTAEGPEAAGAPTPIQSAATAIAH